METVNDYSTHRVIIVGSIRDLIALDRAVNWKQLADAKDIALVDRSPGRILWQFVAPAPALQSLRDLSRQWPTLTFFRNRTGKGHLMVDHGHMLLSIPPKYSGSQVMGYLKGESAIHIARTFGGKRRNFVGQHFWARGYWGSTVGHNEAAVRLDIQEQEKEDQRLDQLGLFGGEPPL